MITRYSIILLTDGGDASSRALSTITDNISNIVTCTGQPLKYVVHCIGYGADHNPTLMAGIAGLTGGEFHCVSNSGS